MFNFGFYDVLSLKYIEKNYKSNNLSGNKKSVLAKPEYIETLCMLEYYMTREASHSVCLHFRHLGRNVNKLLNNFLTMIPVF
jgi:hypothetical protein